MPELPTPADRLNYTGDLTPVVERVCEAYGIGRLRAASVIPVGYEDCNVIIETDETDETDRAKVVAKMFAGTRTPEDIARYTTIMQRVVEAGVNHPALLTTRSGETVFNDSGIPMVVMDHVSGKSFFELNRPPTDEERRAVLEQAARINRIDYNPPYFFDDWAIPNIHDLFEQVEQFVNPGETAWLREVIAAYDAVPVSDLPHCFVHGDLTKPNVMKGDDGEIHVLDFSVANRYPRIQELAVIVANLLHDKSGVSLEQKCRQVADEYSRFNPLTEAERQQLPAFAFAAFAMEVMGAYREKYLHGNDTKENAYWLNVGEAGLRALGRISIRPTRPDGRQAT